MDHGVVWNFYGAGRQWEDKPYSFGFSQMKLGLYGIGVALKENTFHLMACLWMWYDLVTFFDLCVSSICSVTSTY